MGFYDRIPLLNKQRKRTNERHNTNAKEVLHNLLCKKT